MAMLQAVRVRFAPSPTGHMHIGNLRTALFNWLFARHNGGAFLIRIEDTDLERSLPEYTRSLLEALAWLSLSSDEPVVIQSEQVMRHREVAQELLAKGLAYKCYCTPEELRMRLGDNAALGEGYAFYDEKCRNKVLLEDQSKPYAIRFKIPREIDEIGFNDLIRGNVSFKREQFDDFIIVRSDGFPMYNFVVVVDDADMGITHVIRGEDHIPNTPKQILLYRACDFAVPEFAHLSLILGPEGHRLSKRDAATAVLDYKRAGFLADALCNYLVRLGWAHGDQEIFTREELIRLFTLEEVGKKGAIFDIKKLEWINGVFIRNSSAHELRDLIVRDIDSAFQDKLKDIDEHSLFHALTLYKERIKTLRELDEIVSDFFRGATEEELKVLLSYPESVKGYLEFLLSKVEHEAQVDRQSSEKIIKEVCARLSLKISELAQPLRVALTGKISSPGVYDLMAALGRERIRERLRKALAVWE